MYPNHFKIFNIKTEKDFNDIALQIFNYQYKNNTTYKTYTDKLKTDISRIKHYKQIPFLPIEFFKTHEITTADKKPETVFKSSGTTGMTRSRHYVYDTKIYEKSFTETFKIFYGSPENFVFLALLPSYSEQGNSSLIYMVEKLMRISGKKDNGFFLYNHDELAEKLVELEKRKEKTILFGVSFALTDFFENYKIPLQHTEIIETGGMKGRKKETVREEIHKIIKNATGLKHINSEYGMTELLSQAYAKDGNNFRTPPWMKILVRDTDDPFSYLETEKTGGINVIDLANVYSCSFIETKDLGKLQPGNSFEILGRFDNSDIRGCNLMVI